MRRLFLLLFFAAYAALPATSVTLANSLIRAQLGDRGLASLEDLSHNRTFRFADDSFSITVDGTELAPAKLTRQTVQQDKDAVTYRYAENGFVIEVRYRLVGASPFVTKSVAIVSGPRASFHVNSVKPLDLKLEENVERALIPKTSHPVMQTKEYGAFLRLIDKQGLFAVVQNPFLEVDQRDRRLTIEYKPDMAWETSSGTFQSDIACVAPYTLTGRKLAASMTPEWHLPTTEAEEREGFDSGEVEIFQQAVRLFLLDRKQKPIRVFVGWCANDYQIDVATTSGKAEYKRMISRASELGAQYILYAPANSALSRRDQSTDAWHWEFTLWLGLGQQIREGKWDIASGTIPPSVSEMLAFAKVKHTKLLAYVYPVLPFSQHPEWLVNTETGRNANLGFRGFQDWLVEQLVTFFRRTGIGGYSFDYTFLAYPGASRYAQWYGWRRVLEELRRQEPDIVIDGRQSYHMFGPWTWLAGSYPHPTANDEQPESFVNFPDLHFDRVSADRERYTAYWYRNFEFAPTEVIPGYMTHQTPRGDESGEMPTVVPGEKYGTLKEFRKRDWDYLGWRYSVISSIGVAGCNSVIDMLPARDLEEYDHFSPADIQWFRRWLDWADQNKELLRHTRSILGPPAIGRIDGTAAIQDGKGYVFLFNPNARRLTARLSLDRDLGLEQTNPFSITELYPVEGRRWGKPEVGYWDRGDLVELAIAGTSAMVLKIEPKIGDGPTLFGAPGQVKLAGSSLKLTNIRGEAGTEQDLVVVAPEAKTITTLYVNGLPYKFERQGKSVSTRVRFGGEAFGHSEQIGTYSERFAGGKFKSSFRIPDRVKQQLETRRSAWSIPWTVQDRETPWLVPERLLVYVQMGEPDDSWTVEMAIDGRQVPLKKAYSSLHPYKAAFTGFYADVSSLEPNRHHDLTLQLPKMKPGQFQGVFFENVEPEYTEEVMRVHKRGTENGHTGLCRIRGCLCRGSFRLRRHHGYAQDRLD